MALEYFLVNTDHEGIYTQATWCLRKLKIFHGTFATNPKTPSNAHWQTPRTWITHRYSQHVFNVHRHMDIHTCNRNLSLYWTISGSLAGNGFVLINITEFSIIENGLDPHIDRWTFLQDSVAQVLWNVRPKAHRLATSRLLGGTWRQARGAEGSPPPTQCCLHKSSCFCLPWTSPWQRSPQNTLKTAEIENFHYN